MPFDCETPETCELAPMLRAIAMSPEARDAAEAMAERGLAWARTHLSESARDCYWRFLLEALQSLYGPEDRDVAALLAMNITWSAAGHKPMAWHEWDPAAHPRYLLQRAPSSSSWRGTIPTRTMVV